MRTSAKKGAICRQIKGGTVPANLRLLPTESLMDYINQNGLQPGPVKLAQFRAALSLRRTPPLYAQDGKGDNAIIYVKMFDPCGSATWYLLKSQSRRRREMPNARSAVQNAAFKAKDPTSSTYPDRAFALVSFTLAALTAAK